ncbi:MAG: FAD:protein FMN transferase [Spirosomaceae bacterium]|nr:FAD:protein FMN transferase [Spirosomataceae bacterium]
MKITIIRSICVLLTVGMVAFSCKKAAPKFTTLQGNAQGTTFRFIFQDSSERDFSEEIDSLFRSIDKSMSLWDSTSIITQVNAGNTNLELDEPFVRVFNASERISKITEGAFDITVAPLVKAWGFSFKKDLPPPTDLQIDSLKSLIDYRKLSIHNGKLIRKKDNVSVDFNAIAQGYSVDAVAEFLEVKGVTNYMVEIGGEVRASGVNSRNEAWNIGIDKPIESGKRELQTVVSLKNQSLATSGSYRKFTERGGKKYSHTIDPKTGYPVTHNLLSASVLMNNCTDADGYATACMVLGVEKSLELAKKVGFEVYLIFENEKGEFEVKKSAGFEVL